MRQDITQGHSWGKWSSAISSGAFMAIIPATCQPPLHRLTPLIFPLGYRFGDFLHDVEGLVASVMGNHYLLSPTGRVVQCIMRTLIDQYYHELFAVLFAGQLTRINLAFTDINTKWLGSAGKRPRARPRTKQRPSRPAPQARRHVFHHRNVAHKRPVPPALSPR